MSADIEIPAALPLLEALSWFDRAPRQLSLRGMLERYESGFKDWGGSRRPPPKSCASSAP